MNILSTSEGLTVFNGSAYRQIKKTGGQKMGIFMDSIDFNECLKRKKESEKAAESTAPEEVKEEKVEEKEGKK